MSRYVRQMQVPGIGAVGQARLTASHVLVVGAGGLGCTVIPALAAAGVGRLTVVDPDVIELTNLHRQTLYTAADLGQPKAVAAAARARALNPECQAMALRVRLDPANTPALIDGADLVVDAADSFAVTYTLSDLCLATGKPLISASVIGRAGYAGGFCGAAPSYRAVFPDLPAQAASCASAGVLGPAVAALGAVQAQMALSVLIGWSQARWAGLSRWTWQAGALAGSVLRMPPRHRALALSLPPRLSPPIRWWTCARRAPCRPLPVRKYLHPANWPSGRSRRGGWCCAVQPACGRGAARRCWRRAVPQRWPCLQTGNERADHRRAGQFHRGRAGA